MRPPEVGFSLRGSAISAQISKILPRGCLCSIGLYLSATPGQKFRRRKRNRFHKKWGAVEIGWGTRSRTSIRGVRVRRPTIERSPNLRVRTRDSCSEKIIPLKNFLINLKESLILEFPKDYSLGFLPGTSFPYSSRQPSSSLIPPLLR